MNSVYKFSHGHSQIYKDVDYNGIYIVIFIADDEVVVHRA